MKQIILAIGFFLSLQSATAQPGDEKAIRDILGAQTRSWNEGNLETFMSGYWKSDSLIFISNRGLNYGWQSALNSYKKSYPDTVAMGKLRFEILEVNRLSVMYFFVAGKWFLTRSVGNLNGTFTLLIKKINDKWVIVRDHSS